MSLEMPHGGVDELLKSPSGREHLKRIQEANKIKLLQPSDPMFEKVYGNDIKKGKKIKEKQERMARDEWSEKRIKEDWEKTFKRGERTR